MDKIIIAFNDKTPQEIDEMAGEIQSVSIDALLPAIQKFIRLREDETIDGLVINDTDIRVKISRRRMRKQRSDAGVKKTAELFDNK